MSYLLRERPGDGLLTPRQLEVLRLVSNGYGGSEIGRLLGIGLQTVKFHKRTIFEQLDVPNAPAAVAVALPEGLIV
jgi:DNA-binding CsgD family transcriptional regulator